MTAPGEETPRHGYYSDDDLAQQREEDIRARLEEATPGPWERGHVWLVAGLIYSDTGERVDSQLATRCAYCGLGDPTWAGRADINGTMMAAHRHRSDEPYDVEHSISSAGGGLVAYEGGGIVRGEDTQFIVSARDDVEFLLATVAQLRARLERAGAGGEPHVQD